MTVTHVTEFGSLRREFLGQMKTSSAREAARVASGGDESEGAQA